MIEHLSTLIENFPGPANQMRCFTHILNLVAKSILCQFDVAKKSEGAPDDSNDAVRELAALAQELDLGPDGHAGTNDDDEEGGDDDNDNDNDNDGEGLGDEDGMSEEEAMVL
jgi:phage terminase small subunit